jgi:putative membrane protein
MTPSERRLHPLSIVFGLAPGLRGLLIPLVLVLAAARPASMEIWIAVFLAPYSAFAVIRYLGLRYRYDPDELVIRTGLVFRNERHIPYARIQNINAVQGILHRIFGVVEARVETAGGTQTEAHLSVLTAGALEEMRRRVAEAKREAAGAAGAPGAERGPEAAPAPPPATTILRLDLADLAVLGLLDNRGMVVIAAAFGFAWELDLLGGTDSIAERLFESAAGALFAGRLPGSGAAGRAAAALLGLLAALALLRVLSIGWAVVKLHGFVLERRGAELRTTYGLLTRVTATIPLHRVQALTIRQTPLQRLFGRASVRAETAGGAGGGEDGDARHRWIAPLARVRDLAGILGRVQPEADLSAAPWAGIDPRAFRRLLKLWLLPALLIPASLAAPAGAWALAPLAILVPWAILGARLEAAHTAYALAPEAVLLRTGSFWRRVRIVRYGKIQGVGLAGSPFDRRWGMAGVGVDAAGTRGGGFALVVPYLPAAEARRVFDHLAARAAGTAFRW